MQYINLGKRSDLRVSKTGVGLWQASAAWNGSDYRVMDAVGKAHELGVNLVDTAEHYGSGHSESVLGQALKEYGRDNFFVATKVYGPHLRYDELQKAADSSARRLGVDQIDLLQVHWPDPWEQIPMRDTMKALEKLYLQGSIRAIGVSNFAVRDLEEARSILSRTDIVSDQVRYNLLQREVEEEVIPYARRNNISIIAWSPLAQGALSGKYGAGNAPSGDIREKNPLFIPENLAKIEPMTGLLTEIGEKYGKTSSQVAINWLCSQPDVIPIPGAKSVEQVQENVSAMDFSLSRDDLNNIERAYEKLKIDYLPEHEGIEAL